MTTVPRVHLHRVVTPDRARDLLCWRKRPLQMLAAGAQVSARKLGQHTGPPEA